MILQVSKKTADQTFYNSPSNIIPNSELKNKVANIEFHIFEVKKAALQKQRQALTANNLSQARAKLVVY